MDPAPYPLVREIRINPGRILMISNDLDLRIAQLQKEITGNECEINRRYFENVNKRHELKELQAERDRISGLKTRVIDGEIQMGVSYHGGRL